MGLDQYAYAARKDEGEGRGSGDSIEIAYWRKHPNLQGWMEQLWRDKISVPVGVDDIDRFIEDSIASDIFNGVELELTWEDIEQLEHDIQAGSMANLDTKGFFFGNPSDEYYRERDLEFCRDARVHLFNGLRVFYNSSW